MLWLVCHIYIYIYIYVHVSLGFNMAGTLRVKALSLTPFNSQRFRKLSSWQRSILAFDNETSRGNFSCIRHLFTHLFIPGSFLLCCQICSVPYFFHLPSRSRTTFFLAELAIKIPYLKDPSLFFHEHFSDIFSCILLQLFEIPAKLRYQDNVIKVALEL